jgi:hypothetical protein
LAGIVPAAIGSFAAGFVFIHTNDIVIANLFNKRKKSIFYDVNWKLKFLISYLISDFFKITIFLPFELRKQRFQMLQAKKDMKIKQLSGCMLRAYPIILTREFIFRVITLGSFFKFCLPEHKPKLKFDLEEVRDLIKMAEQEGKQLHYHFFMDYSNMVVRSKDSLFAINVMLSTFFATVLTHPFDVINTKILTQTELKYTGFFQAAKLVMKEEGINSLLANAIYFRFLFNVLSVSISSYVFLSLNSKIVDGSR